MNMGIGILHATHLARQPLSIGIGIGLWAILIINNNNNNFSYTVIGGNKPFSDKRLICIIQY